MQEKTNELLNELLSQINSKEELESVRSNLFKRGVESLLKAEMTAHLGYPKGAAPKGGNIRNGYSSKTIKTSQGDQRIDIPRDREASFDPILVPKHKSMTEELEGCVILLYAKGVSNGDIVDFMEKTYGVKYSTSQISMITNQLLSDIREWQIRPLADQYAVVWIDAIHYKIRQDGKVISKACMVVLGIDMDGRQDILSLSILENESAAGWMGILDNLKSRGVKDILFLCSDNLSGITKAGEAVFPNSIHQICIVHQVRNSLRYVNWKDRKAIIKDIKAIYQSINEESAKEAFEIFKQRWSKQYPIAVRSWEENWNHLTAFLSFPQEIRKLIYTTNIIESFNAVLRKHTKNKRVFPTDDAALKSIYLAFQQIKPRWEKSRIGWTKIRNQLAIHFEKRILDL